MKTYYCTLADARREIVANKTFDDAYVMSLIAPVSQRFAALARKEFEPMLETRTLSLSPATISSNGRLINVGSPVLEILSSSINGQALTVGTDITLWPAWHPYPQSQVEILRECWAWCGNQPTGTITGYFGWRTQYATQGWRPTLDSLSVAVNDTIRTLSVTDADGEDEDGYTPRFSPGQLLRIDTEFMRVLSVDAVTNTLTVRRGERGTTAIIHAANASIETWSIEEDVRRAIQRWVALSYQRRASFETRTVTDVGVVSTPADMPREVYATAQQYVNF